VPDASPLTDRLQELFAGHRLSPAQRRIARYLVTCGDEVLFLNSSDIAAAVKVSQPSVTRFAFALGFDGFPQLREQIRSFARESAAGGATPSERNLIQELVDDEARNLDALADSLADPRRLQRVGAALATSRPLPILGLRVSAPLAEYVGVFARKVLPDVRVLTHSGSPLVDEISRCADVGATWMLAIGLPRYPRELHEAMVQARQRGLKIALITDTAIGPLTHDADEVLVAPVGSGFAFDSQAAPAALCAALLHTMLEALPEEDQARLEEFEQTVKEQRLFLDA
jgi:DNA-binding MurR/RpiR family transcriptional regulator